MESNSFDKKIKKALGSRQLKSDHLWDALEERLEGKEKRETTFYRTKIAAGVFILLGVGVLFFGSNYFSSTKSVVIEESGAIQESIVDSLHPTLVEETKQSEEIPNKIETSTNISKREKVLALASQIQKKGYVKTQMIFYQANIEVSIASAWQNAKAENEARKLLQEALAEMNFEEEYTSLVSADELLQITEMELTREATLKGRLLEALKSGYEELQYVFNNPEKKQEE